MVWLKKLKRLFTKSKTVIILNEEQFRIAERVRRITAKVSVSDAVDEALIRFETILKAQFRGKRIIVTTRKTRLGEMEFKSFLVDIPETEKCFGKERKIF